VLVHVMRKSEICIVQTLLCDCGKTAIEIREHLPESNVFCFYMDMRMEALIMKSSTVSPGKWGVNFIRGKVSEASENIDGKLIVKVEDTLAGRPLRMEIDMLVLMAAWRSLKVAKNSLE